MLAGMNADPAKIVKFPVPPHDPASSTSPDSPQDAPAVEDDAFAVDQQAPVARGEMPPTDAPPDLPDTSGPSMGPRELLLALIGVAAVCVMVAFDSTIVTTSLPRVAEALNGLALYAWVGSGYMLATAVTIPIFGRMGDLFGRKRLLLAAVAIVALCSVACGLAQTMTQLVIARTLQGIGGGMMIATAFAAPADLLPDPKRRVRWQALLSAAFAVASGVGPVLGGAITEIWGWRMAFMVVPLTALPTLWVLYRHFPNMRTDVPAHERRIDWIGGLLLVVGVGAPLMALQLAFEGGGRLTVAMGLLAAGALALLALVPYERRIAAPMLPLRVLATREAQYLNIAGLLVGAVMFVAIYFGPLLLQGVLQIGPSTAGLLMTPLVMGIPIGSILNSYLFPRQAQPQRLMVLGAVILAAGCMSAMVLREGVSPNWALLAFGLTGMGLGLLLPNLTLFMQMMAQRRDVGVASAIIQTTRAIGSAAGIAAVGVVVSKTSVLAGIRIGLIGSLVCCLVIALLAMRIRMRNTP